MDKRLEQFFAAAQQISLTSEEKHLCREALQQLDVADDTMPVFASATAFGLTPAERRQSRSTLETFMRQSTPQPAKVSIWQFILHPHGKRLTAVVATLAIILTGSGGVAYASEQSLPGDALYSVKVNVTEPLWEKMQFKPEDRAVWSKRRIERRMDEAERLMKSGDFSPPKREQLEEHIAFHAERMAQFLDNIDSETVPSDLLTEMEADLEKHEAVLSGLKNDSITDEELDAFLASIRSKHDKLRQKHPKGPPPDMQFMPSGGRGEMVPPPPDSGSGLDMQRRFGRRLQFDQQRSR